jgi:CheY-like chemotaxis protein
LRKDKHLVKWVSTATQALSASLLDEFDLLICDVHLPDIQGVELVRAIKAQSPLQPVMTVGDEDVAVWMQTCLDAGASCYLRKPIAFDELLHEIRMVEKARLRLRTVIIDPDPIHRTRVAKTLTALGCQVRLQRLLTLWIERQLAVGVYLCLTGAILRPTIF